MGEGHRLAARRRVWVRQEEEKREEARRAHWHANVIGRGVFREREDSLCSKLATSVIILPSVIYSSSVI